MKNSTFLRTLILGCMGLSSLSIFGSSTTYTFDFSTMYTNAQNLSSVTSTSTDGNIQLTFAKNNASTNTSYYDSGTAVRLYQDASGVKGGSILISGLNGATITGVTAVCDNSNSSDSAYFSYDIGAGTVDFSSCDVSSLSTSSFECYCVGKTSSQRVYVQKLTVTYEISTTGITPTESIKTGISASNGNIVFTASGDEKVQIYTAVGQLLVNTTATAGENSIAVNTKGMLIVKVGSKTAKVVL